MKQIITLLFITALCASCTKSSDKVLNPSDYNTYLETDNSAAIATAEKELTFWNNRIKKDSLQLIDLSKSAGLQSKIFQENTSIQVLKDAEKNLTRAVKVTAIGKDGKLLALAQNYITQHRFKEAKILVDSARVIAGGEIEAVNLVSYDVAMELGDYKNAKITLDKETDFSSYNYLIRLAKWEDYQGNLDKTIQHMETAKGIAEAGKNKALLIWVYTNLADYYGHAGRIKDSYEHYLKALDIDASNLYAKKGLAWIAYANDNNPEEALRIIQSIETQSMSPDYALLKSEIYEYQGDDAKSDAQKEEFLRKSMNPSYGEMYNAYHIDVYAADQATADKALAIATREIENRATPETYDLLSYAQLANGNPEEALKTQQEYVIGKTYEPNAQLHLAQIYKELGMGDKVTPLKEELLEASYELGPLTTQTVKSL